MELEKKRRKRGRGGDIADDLSMPKPTSSTSINDLAADSLAQIFACLPPDERVRLERVCRHWGQIAKKYAWTEFRTLTLDGQELVQRGDLALLKYQALIARCSRYLRELSLKSLGARNVFVEQHSLWTMLRNLRHLRFDDSRASAGTVRSIVDNLRQLQSVNFSDIDWSCAAELRDLLRVDNTSLQALRLPVDKFPDPLGLPALPSSLRSLHISARPPYSNLPSWFGERKRDRIDELLELAASYCPQLAMLMLPMHFAVSQMTLIKLARFEKLFYLRLCFQISHTALFADLLAKIGTQLRALLLENIDSKIVQLIADHCPLLEHCSFDIFLTNHRQLSALQSLFQLPRLRSVSIGFIRDIDRKSLLRTQILGAIHGLNAKGNIEYLHLSRELPLPVKFITNLFQMNHKLRKLACRIQRNQTRTELVKLNTLLHDRQSPVELELFEHCPAELEVVEDSGVRVRLARFREDISQPMLRQFWAQTMDSVPDLGNLDD